MVIIAGTTHQVVLQLELLHRPVLLVELLRRHVRQAELLHRHVRQAELPHHPDLQPELLHRPVLQHRHRTGHRHQQGPLLHQHPGQIILLHLHPVLLMEEAAELPDLIAAAAVAAAEEGNQLHSAYRLN